MNYLALFLYLSAWPLAFEYFKSDDYPLHPSEILIVAILWPLLSILLIVLAIIEIKETFDPINKIQEKWSKRNDR